MKSYYLEGNPLRKWLVLTAVCLAVFTITVNTTAVMNALLAMSNELHLTPIALQWIVNAYMLACASFIVVGGQLGDLFGRRNMFFVGAGFFIISSLIIALGHHPTTLIVGRALQGLSAAIVVPMTLAITKFAFLNEKESFAIALWTGAVGLGFAFCPVISGIFSTYLSWRYIFWANIPLMFIAIIMARLFARKSRGAREDIRLDLWGLAFLAFGLITLTLGLVEGNVWGWSSLKTLILLIAGVFLLLVFWFLEHHVRSPLVHFSHFRKRLFIAGNIGIAASLFTMMGMLYFFNTFIQNPFLLHYSALRAGIAILPISVSIFLLSLVASTITKHWGYRLPMALGLVLIAIGTFILHNVTIYTTYYALWFPLLLTGLGLGLVFPNSPSLGMQALPKEKLGEGAGIINTINYYSGILCVAIGTLISILLGREKFYQSIAPTELPSITLSQIDRAVFGHQGNLQQILSSLSDSTQNQLIHAIQLSTVKSFTAVMLMCFTMTIIGLIGICFFARSKT